MNAKTERRVPVFESIDDDFIRAIEHGDSALAAACCDADAEFVLEEHDSVPVVIRGARSYVAAYAPRPEANYVVSSLSLHPSPSGAVGIWRAVAFEEAAGARHVFGVSVWHLTHGRITRCETVAMPAPFVPRF